MGLQVCWTPAEAFVFWCLPLAHWALRPAVKTEIVSAQPAQLRLQSCSVFGRSMVICLMFSCVSVYLAQQEWLPRFSTTREDSASPAGTRSRQKYINKAGASSFFFPCAFLIHPSPPPYLPLPFLPLPFLSLFSIMDKEEAHSEKYVDEKFNLEEPHVNLEEEDDSPIEEVRVTVSSK